MKLFIALLAGYALLSRPTLAAAQGGIARGPTVGAVISTAAPASVRADSSGAGTQKEDGLSRQQVKACCQKALRDIRRIYYLNSRYGKMKLQVRGIYTRSTALFFVLQLINRSPLDYAIDSIRFRTGEKSKGSRDLLGLQELPPIYLFDSATLVRGYSRLTRVIVLPRFTLGRHRRLQLEVLERNGQRRLQVRMANFTLETARRI